MTKIDVVGLTRDELESSLKNAGLDKSLVRPLWNAVYVRGLSSFFEIPDVARAKQSALDEHFQISRPGIVREWVSTDHTRKWLLEMGDQRRIESVMIPEQDCGALCVSSQVGCSLTCSFCSTGTMPFSRNLSASEIVGQVMNARDRLQEWGRQRSESLLTNIVLMGMGEPLFNYDQVVNAIRVITDGDGLGISRRRIMLSTAVVVPMIHRLGEDVGVNLAISLHAVRNDLRNELVPLNRKYPIESLLNACRNYPAASNARRITFEYVMLRGVNDSDADARELGRLLNGIPAKVNLIPWNPWPGSDYQTSTPERIKSFAKLINEAGYSAAIRATRGEDISAACGQLNSLQSEAALMTLVKPV